MPIIKDKYGAKGENLRSKYVTRQNTIVQDNFSGSSLSTFQKKEQEADRIRSAGEQQSLYDSGQITQDTEKIGLLSGYKLGNSGVVNILENILILNSGESLKDIIISHLHGSATSTVFSLYWSTSSPEEIKYTLGTGVVSDVTRGTLYRLMSDTLLSSSTLALNSNNMFDSFNNINKSIYFYAISSVRGTDLTILKC